MKTELGQCLRPVDCMLLFPDKPAEQQYGQARAPVLCAARDGSNNLPMLRLSQAVKDPPGLGEGDSTLAVQLFAGETTFATKIRKKHLHEIPGANERDTFRRSARPRLHNRAE